MELKGLDLAVAKDKARANLYKTNSRLAAIFTLGQQSAHGLGYLEQTKSDDFPSGIVFRALELMKDRYAPKNLGSEIQSHSRMLVTILTLLLRYAISTVQLGLIPTT